MIKLSWMPTEAEVDAEVERLRKLREKLAKLETLIRKLQISASQLERDYNKRPAWAADPRRGCAGDSVAAQANCWRLAARATSPAYTNGESVYIAMNGSLYAADSRSSGRGTRYKRQGALLLVDGKEHRPVTKEEAEEMAAHLQAIADKLEGR